MKYGPVSVFLVEVARILVHNFTLPPLHSIRSNFTQTYLGVDYIAEREMTSIDLELGKWLGV